MTGIGWIISRGLQQYAAFIIVPIVDKYMPANPVIFQQAYPKGPSMN